MVPKRLLGLVLALVAIAGAAWFYHFVDEQTDPPFEPAQPEDSSG